MKNATNLMLDGEKAAKNKQNILVLTHLDDCPYCHLVRDEVLNPMSKLADYNYIIMRQIDAHSFEDLVDFDGSMIDGSSFITNHKIDFFPTLLLFNPQGKILEKVIGVSNIDYYWSDLDTILAKYQ
jgi:thioredoxin-related protein